jgi:hypothetical protein
MCLGWGSKKIKELLINLLAISGHSSTIRCFTKKTWAKGGPANLFSQPAQTTSCDQKRQKNLASEVAGAWQETLNVNPISKK